MFVFWVSGGGIGLYLSCMEEGRQIMQAGACFPCSSLFRLFLSMMVSDAFLGKRLVDGRYLQMHPLYVARVRCRLSTGAWLGVFEIVALQRTIGFMILLAFWSLFLIRTVD